MPDEETNVSVLPEIETRIVVLAEDVDITPDQLLIFVSSNDDRIELRATCYGLIIQGPSEEVGRVVRLIREMAPFSVFTKQRGFHIGHRAKCRKGRVGGMTGAPRPGFYQLEIEASMLKMISEAIETLDKEDAAQIQKASKEYLDEAVLRRIIPDLISELEV